MSSQTFDLSRSIAKKQTVAVTGLLLILFIIVHLVGNLFIYAGPEAYNGWAAKLKSFGTLTKIAEWTIFAIFLLHVERVTSLVVGNIRAAGGLKRYAVDNARGKRSLSTKLRNYTGAYLLIYLIWHLLDFTFSAHHGPKSIINAQDMGLYGLVINSFKDPMHAWAYVIAMGALGFHLAHGVQSFIQTFGFNDSRFTPCIRRFSLIFAWVIGLAYASIPLYVLYVLKI